MYQAMLKAYKGRSIQVEYPPLHIYLELTNKCNLKCSHCVHNGQMKRPKGDMSSNLIVQILSEVYLIGIEWVYLFLHGESCLNIQGLSIAVRDCRWLGIKTRLHTNGRIAYYSEDLIDILKQIDKLVISINEPPNFNKYIRHIIKLHHVLVDKQVNFRFSVLPSTLKKIECSEIQEIRDFASCVKILGNVKPLYNWHDRSIDKTESNLICSHPYKSIAILWNGDCVPCCADYGPFMKLGTIKDHGDLRKIWNGPEMQKVRSMDPDFCKFCNGCNIERLPKENYG